MILNTILSALPHTPMTLTVFRTQSLQTLPGTNFLFKSKYPILNLEPLEEALLSSPHLHYCKRIDLPVLWSVFLITLHLAHFKAFDLAWLGLTSIMDAETLPLLYQTVLFEAARLNTWNIIFIITSVWL